METKVLGQVGTVVLHGKCSESACDGAAITSLDQQDFCLTHFLERCYERLEAVDPRGQRYRTEPATPAAMRAFIEECSRKALDVSLGCEDLSNLERGRLLDILLWAGELFLLLRAPQATVAGASAPQPSLAGASSATGTSASSASASGTSASSALPGSRAATPL